MVAIRPIVGRHGVCFALYIGGSYCRCDFDFVSLRVQIAWLPAFSRSLHLLQVGPPFFPPFIVGLPVSRVAATTMAFIMFVSVDAMLGGTPVGTSCARAVVGGITVWAPLLASCGSYVQACLSAGSPSTPTSARATGVARLSPPSPSVTLGSRSPAAQWRPVHRVPRGEVCRCCLWLLQGAHLSRRK